jgi:hypothetical protein
VVSDAFIAVVIVIAVIATLRGDVSKLDVIRIGRTLITLAAIGLTLLYVPTWLYESIFDRDAPSWLTIATTAPILVLASMTPILLTPPRSTKRNQES